MGSLTAALPPAPRRSAGFCSKICQYRNFGGYAGWCVPSASVAAFKAWLVDEAHEWRGAPSGRPISIPLRCLRSGECPLWLRIGPAIGSKSGVCSAPQTRRRGDCALSYALCQRRTWCYRPIARRTGPCPVVQHHLRRAIIYISRVFLSGSVHLEPICTRA
jgi:hypothetical protein